MSETGQPTVQRSRAREERVIALLLAGKTVKEICEQVPMTRSTLWRMRRAPEFQERFRTIRQDSFQNAVNALHNSAVLFVTTLADVCRDPTSRGSERATAARSGLDSLWNAAKLFDLEERLRKLEETASEGQK